MKVTFDVVVAEDKKSATLKMSVPDIPNAIEVMMEEEALDHLLGQLGAARKQIAVTRIEEETSQPFNRKDWVGIDFSALDEDVPHDAFAQAFADVLDIPKYQARMFYNELREYGVNPKTRLSQVIEQRVVYTEDWPPHIEVNEEDLITLEGRVFAKEFAFGYSVGNDTLYIVKRVE